MKSRPDYGLDLGVSQAADGGDAEGEACTRTPEPEPET